VHGLAIPLGNLALLSPRLLSMVRGLGRDKDDGRRRSGIGDDGGPERRPLLDERSV
jgi:hypothetical protein